MRRVLAWLRFLGWGVFYALLMGAMVTGGVLLFLMPVISIWLWGTPTPGVVAFIVIVFLGGGIVIAEICDKAPK